MKGKKVDIRLGRGLANQIKINKTIPVSHKPKEERRMMFICGDDIASLIKRFEMNQSNIKSGMCLVRLFLYICGMARGYYWIPQTDETLNGRSYYVAKIVGDITFDTKRKRIVFQADRYFPVGSVFHFTHNCFNYIITCRLRKPGLWFEARREDSGPICPEDIERFESGRFIHRDGYMHYI